MHQPSLENLEHSAGQSSLEVHQLNILLTHRLVQDSSSTERCLTLRGRVEQELKRLQQQGNLKPVAFSDWAVPIVPILKKDGSVRICGDYQLTVNQVAKLETYPLPKIDDLLTFVAGGKTFTKLDLVHAYQQVKLEGDSRKFVTINTHKGL